MSFFSKIFGKSDTQIAEEYVESQWPSGLTRHYHAEAVLDSIEMQTGVRLPDPGHAVQIVEKVRASHGWAPRSYDSYFPEVDEDEE